MTQYTGQQPVWTTYTYDGLGRTKSVVSPDGASTTSYIYQGNITSIIDPAGKWKQYITDAMNHLTQVIEPDPSSAGGSGGNTGTAAFVRTDTTTLGNWKNVYGANGYNVINDTVSYPGYVTVTPSGNSTYVWASSTSDARGLRKAASSTDRIAATWYTPNLYAPGSFTIDLAFSDQASHQVALYCVDWDSTTRAQTIAVQDSNGVVLDTRTMSGFNGGQYLVWNLSGHVRLVVSWVAGYNGVVSGLFFDTAAGGGGGGGGALTTSYSYDLVDNLTQVSMPRSNGTQTRTFTYQSGNTTGGFVIFHYLDHATNPENGTVTYTWVAPGKPASKIDAKGQKIIYTYDTSLRLTQIQRYPAPGNVEDICQRTTYTYDTNNGGFSQYPSYRLTSVTYGTPLSLLSTGSTCGSAAVPYGFTEMYSYTPAGAVAIKRLAVTANINPGQSATLRTVNLDTSQTYDNEGKVQTVKYPDANGQTGRTYTYTYDGLGRPTQLTDNQQTPVSWVSNVQYGPSSELLQMTYGNSIGYVSGNLVVNNYSTETRSYNSRLQMTRLTVPGAMDMEYRYSATQNNGQITQQKDWASGEEVTYTYDSLQRLIAASTTDPSWGQSFTYDGFGNRTGATQTKGTAPSSSFAFDPATNWIIGASYDLNGNTTANGAYAYDVDNRLVNVSGAEFYAYAAGNKRIWKQMPDGTQELYYYGISGQKLATLTPTIYIQNSFVISIKDLNVYFGSKTIVSKSVSVVMDRLGSNHAGGSRYFPYGEDQQTTANDKDKFATYYRDQTTGLDYAQNRYYASTQGRFLTPDTLESKAVPPNDPTNPRSWNRYTYANGDPVNLYDPSGRFGCGPDEPGSCDEDYCWYNPFAPECSNPSGPPGTPPPPPPPPQCYAPQSVTLLAVTLGPGSTAACVFGIPGEAYLFGTPLSNWNQLAAGSSFLPVLAGVGGATGTIILGGETLTWQIVIGALGAPEVFIAVAAVAGAVVLYNYIQSRRLLEVRADCSVHQIGTPDHASAGTISATGQGTDFPTARASAYSAAQAAVAAAFGIGFHAQHCRYTQLN